MISRQSTIVIALIINWNRADDTIECIQSLNDSEQIKPNILVVDNGSHDNSISKILSCFPNIKIISTGKNLGYAGGVNIGLSQAFSEDADFVLLINNDAVVHPKTLSTLLSLCGDDVGLCAPIIYYKDDPNRIWSSGGNLIRPLFEYSNEKQGKFDTFYWPNEIERDFVTGCCMLIPRKTFLSIGNWDSHNFFMYYEDVDWCYRIRSAGLRILLIPEAKVWHKVSSSSGGKDSLNERYWMGRSSIIFFRKHVPLINSFFVLPYRIGSTIKTILRLTIQGNFSSAQLYIKGSLDGLTTKII
jgi:GT2 family glycosyltransferase